MSVRIGALVLFTSSTDDCHFAVFPATGDSPSPGLREPGCSFAGFTVESVADALARVRGLGAAVLEEPTVYPWGVRAVVADPDGRPVEIFEPNPA